MSWSVSEENYPGSMSLSEITQIELEGHQENRGRIEPIMEDIKNPCPSKIFEDYTAAREFVHSKITHSNCLAVKYYSPKQNTLKKSKNYEERIESEIRKLKEFSKKHSVKNFKAQYITCPKCGSKLAKEYLNSRHSCLFRYDSFLEIYSPDSGLDISSMIECCPLCDSILQSDKIQDEIKRREQKIVALRDEYWEYKKSLPQEVRWYVYTQCYIG